MTYIDPELTAEEMEIEREDEMRHALLPDRVQERKELARIRARREQLHREEEEEARKAVFIRQFNEVKARTDAERDRIVAQTETYHKLQAILNPRRNSRKDW